MEQQIIQELREIPENRNVFKAVVCGSEYEAEVGFATCKRMLEDGRTLYWGVDEEKHVAWYWALMQGLLVMRYDVFFSVDDSETLTEYPWWEYSFYGSVNMCYYADDIFGYLQMKVKMERRK